MDGRLAELGQRVRAARTQAGQTQAEVAAAVGIHRTHVLHIEAGRENITITTLYGLADHFGLPVSDLLAE